MYGILQNFILPLKEAEFMSRGLKSAVAIKEPGARPLAQMAISRAQRAAQRLALRQRRSVLKMDTWLEEAFSFTGSGMRF